MTKESQRVILFVNGPLERPEQLRAFLQPDDVLIAVDGGLRHLVTLGLTPDLILGDLDSANPSDVEKFQNSGVPVRRYPAEKDETDLQLGLSAAFDYSPAAIRIVAALGGRLDHTLGNIYLLTQPRLIQMDVRLIDGEQEVFLIRDRAALSGRPGQLVSLIPLMGPVPGVTTGNLAYPLRHETLYPEQTRGISNVMTADTATISIDSGLLLCIHTCNETD